MSITMDGNTGKFSGDRICEYMGPLEAAHFIPILTPICKDRWAGLYI
jgi:hypothetical protein